MSHQEDAKGRRISLETRSLSKIPRQVRQTASGIDVAVVAHAPLDRERFGERLRGALTALRTGPDVRIGFCAKRKKS